ncbi:D-lactate dehydrogenase (cytochrome) [Rhodovulum imhoffii]|uniref:D-lactate dehydrogenase (cytochrome) n=1 Tax=Rhodovulum imhoffii TaxID=365340 RepID=A0A2T5BVF1_9RHOB|nr:FAD-linked oxidase C-terminal domain-containing protein [Rhodovulum imhoffii]MBK5934196.1 2-hydroxy-acid oxidase [Rhodovulum imhoffii]PTN03557.1 D-lactate dehydrogenase (cytochrome) [Rhodovulum imhoffii]
MTIETALEALRSLPGARLTKTRAARQAHGENETHFPPAPPHAVVFPETTGDVSEILKICNTHGCPVTAFGAGTSLEGHHLPVRGGISLDTSRMNRVLRINTEDMDATVQPGVTREDLNTRLRATGLFFPVDPGANATLGGMAATRASGTTAVRYGTMRENVLALEAVLADGRIVRTGTRARKSSAGYDLTRLLVGSEGTLAILTELTVRLQGQPEAISAATCRFPSVEDAVNTVITTIQSGLPMARIELVDEMMVRGFNLHQGSDLPEAPHLFLEFHGSEAGVAEQAESFGSLARDFGAAGFRWTTHSEDRSALWRMRHQAHLATRALNPSRRVLSTDVCVPISRLAEAVKTAQTDSRALGLTCTIVGHVGDGNFHCGVLIDPGDPDETSRADTFSDKLAKLALNLGGTVTGEHGIGLGKRKYMHAEHGDAVAIMRMLKSALDPSGILNPGKLLPDAD